MVELKPCKLCGKRPIIEHWSSGGKMYMVKCGNPDCPVPDAGYPSDHNLNDVSVKAVKYADEWEPYDYENLYFTREEAEAVLEKRRKDNGF